MENLIRRIHAFFFNPKNDISAIFAQLKMLETEMKVTMRIANRVMAIVKLFQVLSPIQDNGGFEKTIAELEKKNYGQLDEKIKALKSLQKHFANAGRDLYGMNRTRRGEQVNAENVFLGNVFGLVTFPASYWLKNQKRFETEDSGAKPKDGSGKDFISVWYCINDHQAGTFVESHTMGIINQIAVILK